MPSEMTARAGPLSGVPSERNYQAFYGALSASARGRDFLAEYARRNRKAHGEKLLAAIDKLQSLLPVEGSERAHLTVVPVPEQPELPIPTPAGPQPSSIALVRSEAIIEEVAFIERRAKPIATNENYSPDSAAPSVHEPRTVSEDPGWLHQPIRFNPSRP